MAKADWKRIAWFSFPTFFFFFESLWVHLGRVLLLCQGYPSSGPAVPRVMLSGGARLQDAVEGVVAGWVSRCGASRRCFQPER